MKERIYIVEYGLNHMNLIEVFKTPTAMARFVMILNKYNSTEYIHLYIAERK